MEDIFISIAAKIAEYTVAPVGQWLSYSFHYNSNIENMMNQEEKLQHARERVQRSVDAASRNGETIDSGVNKWLEDVESAFREIKETGVRISNASLLNLEHRHQLSREAEEIVENIAKLLENEKNFKGVSYLPALQEMVTLRNRDYMTFDSRISIMNGIMKALGDANINRIGVWGSAGVGKSTLMIEIFKKAKEEGLFHEVALANVTDNPDLSRIQGEIAQMLDLKLYRDESIMVRASRLRARLANDNEKKKNDNEKRILVILDDIWKQLDLEEIGITPSERCKVLLTSRDWKVLASEMVTEKNSFKLDILGEQEAWKLFEKMVGDSIRDDHYLQNEAIKVAKACARLPIALVTVSRALKDQKSLRIWKDALVQLRRPPSEHDTEIWSPIYSCIELSYKHLAGEEVKSLFLLCARQDYYISFRDLLRYGFGLCLFDGIDTLEEARNRLESLVGNLQDSCLLLQSPHSSKVFYMHDLVRDVAIIIASKNHNMFVMRDDGGKKAWPNVDALNRCEALSIHGGDIHKHPNKMECPKLRFFHVRCKGLRNLKIPNIFFQGMDKLEVLSLRYMQLSSLFPLTNLQTLCLDGCRLGDIHWIGELKTLVILSLADSDISNLPREIELLTCLRLLDLRNCFQLRVIPPNVLSSLVNLEELYMQKTKVQWEVEGPSNEGKNASLAELKRLSHLTTLKIDIRNANNLPATLFHEKLERYKICIGDIIWDPVFMREDAFSRVLKLNLNMSFQLDLGIKMLLKRTEYLSLDEAKSTKSVLYELQREDFQQLKYFHIQNNGNIKHIPVSRTPDVAFPILETFVLNNMFSLEEICQDKLPLSSFKNLKVLKVENCKKLRFSFSSSIAKGLSQLEELNITRCDNLGAIFVKEEEGGIEDQGDMMLFGRLQTLVLEDLPKLVGFLSTKDSFMADCRETNSEGNHDLQLPLLHHDQVSFPSLQTLYMKEIVAVERGGGEAVAIRTLVFPQVTKLSFRNLRRLKWFYKGVHVSKWPMLKEMTIQGCHKVEIFASNVVSFEKAIEDQRQSEMSNIKQPIFSVDEHSFPSLEKLLISNMDSVEIIFGKLEGQNGKEPQDLISPASGTEESGATTHFVSFDKLPLIYFKNLKVLEVENCQKLRFLFSSSIAKGLSLLEKLKIKGCNNMGAIVVTEEKGGIEDGDVILFHQLQTLVLEDLPELVSFSSTKSSFMTDCGQIFAEGNHDLHMPLLHHQMDYIDFLRHHCCQICTLSGQISIDIYCKNLKVLEVENCQKLRFLFSSSIAKGLLLLEKLIIKGCNNMGAIVVTEEKGGIEDGDVILFHQLQTLVLEDLPELVSFSSTKSSFMTDCGQIFAEGNHDLHMPLLHHQVSFPSLQTLHMKDLPKIKHVWSCGQEPKTVLTGLEQLQVLEIEDCGVEEIVAIERGGEAVAIRTLVFPQVTQLKFRNLWRLKWFYKGVHVSKWPMLKQITIEGCKKVEIFASEVGSFEKAVKDQRQFEMSIKQPLFLVNEVSFPSLQTLRMKYLPKIKHVWSCGQEPKTVLTGLEQLQVLEIEDCGVEEIVAIERGGEAVAIRTLVFPQVTQLKLSDLPKLKWFCQGVYVSKWSMLKGMTIRGCHKVEIFASEVVSFEKAVEDQRQSEMSNIKQPLFLVDELSFPILVRLYIINMDSLEIIFGKLEGQNGKEPQVLRSPASGTKESGATTHFASTLSFPSLKKLYIWSLDKLEIIWQDQVTASSFPNIQELDIHNCDKLLHVFQSKLHTTTTLIQSLTSLHIKDCDSLETIFRNMEGQNGKESQVLIAPSFGLEESIAREEETTRHMEFPTLTKMSLVGLPKLKWILEGVHTNLECPSLKRLALGGFGRVINMIWASKFPRSSSSQENQLQTCIQQPIFEFDEATFPNLEILSLRFSRTICPSRFSDFLAGPSFPIIRLPTPLELKVRSSGWEEIFSHELVDREIRLRRLLLNHLPMLNHNLQYLSLSGCGKLKNLVPSSVSLHNLTYLFISSCHGLINLLTSSTAKTLVQLRRMTVTDCKRITEIVAMEDGEANVEITFKYLADLELDGLPNLTHFCSGPYSFGFPSLMEVIVRCCPEMKTFSHGVLSTPKLKGVYDDCNRWNLKRNLHWEDDLNTTTRCLWESNQYDTQCLFRERVENSEEDEDHSENYEEG